MDNVVLHAIVVTIVKIGDGLGDPGVAFRLAKVCEACS